MACCIPTDTLVDGPEADIAMKGSVDLVRRRLDLQAVVAPEISATVGVAAAFCRQPYRRRGGVCRQQGAGPAVEQSLDSALSHYWSD